VSDNKLNSETPPETPSEDWTVKTYPVFFPTTIGIDPATAINVSPADMAALVEAFRQATGHSILRSGVNIAGVWDTFMTMKRQRERAPRSSPTRNAASRHGRR
jgi:hypothetical protein